MIAATMVKTQECTSYGTAVSSSPLGLEVGMGAGVWRKPSRRSAFQTGCNSKPVLDRLITPWTSTFTTSKLPLEKCAELFSGRKKKRTRHKRGEIQGLLRQKNNEDRVGCYILPPFLPLEERAGSPCTVSNLTQVPLFQTLMCSVSMWQHIQCSIWCPKAFGCQSAGSSHCCFLVYTS